MAQSLTDVDWFVTAKDGLQFFQEINNFIDTFHWKNIWNIFFKLKLTKVLLNLEIYSKLDTRMIVAKMAGSTYIALKN